jgi:ATP-dependent exoDNAse (exonuclease V) beta subunit
MVDDIFLKLEETFSDIVFLEKNHSYKIKGETAKMSVSQLIKQYEKPFDSEKIAKGVAEKQGFSVEDILDQWEFKKDYSCHKGSEFHKFVENFLARRQISIDIDALNFFYSKRKKFFNENSIEEYKSEIKNLIKNFIGFYEWWKKDHILLKSEFVVGDKESRICGSIDNLSYNKTTKELVIFDYKTNKDIKKKNDYGEKLLGCLSHFDKCEFIKYSLQLNLYSTIIEKSSNLTVPSSYIVWMNGENYELIKCLDMKNISQTILNEYK